MHTRRGFLVLTASSLVARAGEASIDRKALVSRNNPHLTRVEPRSPLSVGNGELAFTVDITGLQSMPQAYENSTPLCIQSQWGWHTTPMPAGLAGTPLRLENFDTYGRAVGYATDSKGQEPLFNWLRENPHRLNLARIGLFLDGRVIDPADVTGISQTLDLWSGVIESRFELRGKPVKVRTCCHPERDLVAATVESPLVASGGLTVGIEFPYASSKMNASDWVSSSKHQTRYTAAGPGTLEADRTLDADSYWVRLHWEGDADAAPDAAHRIMLQGRELTFTCEFATERNKKTVAAADETFNAANKHWDRFWRSGGAIDFSGSAEPRAAELERRVVLSQYLTAIQCSGSLPPQETGLTCNSWFGKFHLEMHWWHAAHFAMWGRTPLLERSLDWYRRILPSAEEKAQRQGYEGARWPKMTATDGRSSPSNVGELLIWQQPHIIALAELCYRAHPNKETLHRYRNLVLETAEFMASYAVLRENRYVLGPPVIPAQENHPARTTLNPTFELQYWREALQTVQDWRKRMGLSHQQKWADVQKRLAALPVKDGVFLSDENCPTTFTEKNHDHPSMLMALGFLKGDGVDRATMARTLARVMKDWAWADTWGWDFPMVAMTAARLGDSETAMRALFMESPKNEWLPNGHNFQRANLPVYLPGNGALLAAMVVMAETKTFPAKWNVRWEGLRTGV
jgi:protein-glucosylgalactosylhydroxylysine glucosidase